jgi:hypothetical protein
MTALDFLLGPEAFVERCAIALGLRETELTSLDRGALADAIKAGRPRFEILDVIRARRNPLDPDLQRPNCNSVPSEWSSFVVLDLLERFAPENNEAFVRQTFSQLLCREATTLEVIETTFDLKSGRTDRRGLIEKLAKRAGGARLSSVHSVSLPIDRATSEPFKMLLIKYIEGEGWVLAPDITLHVPRPKEGMLTRLEEGWVMTGPKRSLPAGAWRATFELVQADAAEIVIDVVANSGLDVLVRMTLSGPAQVSPCFEIKSWHHFLEVRLFKPTQPEPLRWIKIREISLEAIPCAL